MGINRKLDTWKDAGLITADQVQSINAFEKNAGKNIFKNGLLYVALFSIALGLSLIVAANWQDIAPTTKLCVHFALNIGLATLIYRWQNNPARKTLREACLFLLWGLTLTLIAVIGQTFQLSGNSWTATRFWFVITTPMILVLSQGRYVSTLWALFFVLFVPFDLYTNLIDNIENKSLQTAVGMAAYTTLPAILYFTSRIPAFTNNRPHIADSLKNLSTLLGLVIATFSGTIVFYNTELTNHTLYVFPVLVAVLAGLFILRKYSNKHAVDLLMLCATFTALPFIAPINRELASMMHALILWLGAGYIFQVSEQYKLLNLAIIVITIRLFIGFLQLFGSLMMSGFGFIFMGLVLIALLYLAKRIQNKLVP